MITPSVTELPPVLPSTFIDIAVREGDPRPSAQHAVRRIVD